VTLVVTGTPPDQVDVDEAGIRRCLVNLVGNAIDACSEKGEGLVEVGASAAGDDGCFTHRVKDNGVGISPEVQAQMFDPLFSTKGNKGTGLGLAVTRKIVEEHGGVVRVESAPGVGALFSLILPVKPPVPSSA
jgi:signal transduction histidine kinase